jgi:alkylation response protein AidB-like acyl-CoA dehydrogenase
MDFSLDEAQLELRQAARRFLGAELPLSQAVFQSESPAGWDPQLWPQIAELGWLGVSSPEEFGGAGLSFLEEAILLEEFGRSLYPGPYFATVALALPALDGERLAEVASGRLRWSVQIGEQGLVPNLDQVDLVVVSRGPQLLAVPAVGEGRPSLDPTRRLGWLSAGDGEVLLEGEAALAARAQITVRARASLALEAVGLAQVVLELGVEHARAREQFRRPIGSFEAVSHRLADSYTEIELARSLSYWAAWCISRQDPEAALAAASARAFAAETAVAVCERVIQIFGGMGFTWDSPLHRYYRRALWLERFGWSPARCRSEVASMLLNDPNRPAAEVEARPWP